MTGRALATVGGLLTVAVLSAQTIYNPRALRFEHDDYAITTQYRLNLYADPVDTARPPVFTVDLPQSAVTVVAAPTYELAFATMPAVPVGTTFRATLLALNADGVSPPSNVTPESFRFNACALEGSTGVRLPSLTVQTIPPLTVNTGVMVTLTVTAPHDVQFISLDLIGDGLPAWYYVTHLTTPAQATTTVFWGPFKRAGRYELAGRMVDSGGCEAQLGSGTFVTIR